MSGQEAMAHELPTARLVDRVPFLVEHCRGKRVVHVGFADEGRRAGHTDEGRWLHRHLAEVADELVGLDVDADGVAEAADAGYEAYAVDCCDAEAVAALGLAPADVIVAGEIIEHLDRPGPFLDALLALVAPGGELVITTPNAYGWVNPLAALAGYEVNHPDHVAMYTWRTLTTLLAAHGWDPVEAATFVPTVNRAGGGGWRFRLFGLVARLVVAVQRLLARTVAPFVADGLVVVARPAVAVDP